MLDDRQYRSDNPCGDGEALRCDEALNGRYTMLGSDQEQWLARGLPSSRALELHRAATAHRRARAHAPGYPDEWYWNDAWDGYPLARKRLLTDVVESGLSNPVFLTGDWHSTFANELKLDFKDPASPSVATEFVTPAITTGGDGTPYGPYYAPMIPFNPHIKYFEGDKRGYFKATSRRERCGSISASSRAWKIRMEWVSRGDRRRRRRKAQGGGVLTTQFALLGSQFSVRVHVRCSVLDNE